MHGHGKMHFGGVERGRAYTNVDTARRMRGGFSASDERFVSCERVEVPISTPGHFLR